jgi:transcriptional regulatory protein RtcR
MVDDEITRLRRLWQRTARHDGDGVDLGEVIGTAAVSQLDLFDALQLSAVIKVCRQSKSLSDAGRQLYAVSRDAKSKPNDADRLKKYLARYDLAWDQLTA